MTRFITLLICAFICIPTISTASTLWESVQENSKITFISSYDGIDFEGEFSRFHAEFAFNTNNEHEQYLHSVVDVTSINTNSHDRDQAIAEPDWFHFSKFPKASFTSRTLNQLEDGTFRVSGTIQIRDQSREISFPLTWEDMQNGTARAIAVFELDRRDFNIGLGEWKEDETIGFNVVVSIQLLFKLKQ